MNGRREMWHCTRRLCGTIRGRTTIHLCDDAVWWAFRQEEEEEDELAQRERNEEGWVGKNK
jgi:hypothetical protein